MSEYKAAQYNHVLQCLERAGAEGLDKHQIAGCLGVGVSRAYQIIRELIAYGYIYGVVMAHLRRAPHRYYLSNPQQVQAAEGLAAK